MNALRGWTILDGTPNEMLYIEIDRQNFRINGIRYELFFADELKAKDFLEKNRAHMQTPDAARMVPAALDPNGSVTLENPLIDKLSRHVYQARNGFVTIFAGHPFIPLFSKRGEAWKVLESRLFSVTSADCSIGEVKVKY